MTEQQAINYLNSGCLMLSCEYHIGNNRCDDDYDVKEARKDKVIEMAIKSLEKQIPKKVVFDGNEWTCPHCNTPVLDVNIGWCNICGQKLDWSEEE